MKLDRQNYNDSTFEQARLAGCDCIQLKYDGWWARVVCRNGRGTIYSRTQREVGFIETDPELDGVFIAEYLFGTQWAQKPEHLGQLIVFDCWELGGTSLMTSPYKERYKIVRTLIPTLYRTDVMRVINIYRMDDYPTLWEYYVKSEKYEGVVFRRLSDQVDTTIFRQKLSITEDVFITGFAPGEVNGRHEHRLGALICSTRDGVELRVGGGLSDEQRDKIWTNKEAYLGRWLTVEAKKRFESGSLRHPNFKEWREDLV